MESFFNKYTITDLKMNIGYQTVPFSDMKMGTLSLIVQLHGNNVLTVSFNSYIKQVRFGPCI